MDNNDPNNPNQNFTEGTTPSIPAPLPDAPWPSSTSSTTHPAMDTPIPQPPLAQNPTDTPSAPAEPTPNSLASSPFLGFQSIQPNFPPPGSTQPGSLEPTATKNPFQSVSPQVTQQDPLNTAFAPNPNEANPFSPTEALAASTPIAPSETPMPPAHPIPTPDFLNPAGFQTPTQPQNPITDMALGATGNPSPEGANPNPAQPSPGALDLSSLQANGLLPPEGRPSQKATTLPEMGPVENAPTDLSHLIAGEETSPQPGDIYNPPVASDHNPALNSTQPQTPSEDGAPPSGKHLNLTKVLLVAGIPIILIVAALSLYLILGVGKSSPQSTTNQTSLPVEQTTPEQAPLTNPPQQIVAPSPAVIPEPSESTSSGTTLPGASSSPTSALEQLKARQSASPSPKASSSTTLP